MTLLTLERANTIIEGAFTKAAEGKFHPITVAVVDEGGHVVAVQRQNGSSNLRPQIAIAKASGALGLGVSGRLIGDLAEKKPAVFAALATLAPQGMIPGPGAVIVVDAQQKPIGAVGVTGDTSDNDEVCAAAGVAAAGLQIQS